MVKLRQKFRHGEELDSRLRWLHQPQSVDVGVTNVERMTVGAGKGTDAWQKTYYEPEIVADNAPVFGLDWEYDDFSAMARMRVNPVSLFDQGGIMVKYGPANWIKAGLEYVDGQMRLSVVATNGFSDWTTHGYRAVSSNLTLAVHKRGTEVLIDFGEEEVDQTSQQGGLVTWWTSLLRIDDKRPTTLHFARCCELRRASKDLKPFVGVYAASPKGEGGNVEFDYLIVTQYSRKGTSEENVLLLQQ